MASRREFLLSAFLFRKPSRVTLNGVPFEVIRKGRSNRRYLLIHGNEQTARTTLRAHMKSHSGVAHLVMGDKRNVTVAGGLVDPNRMFSRAGAERSYRRLNPNWTSEQITQALDWMDREREKLINALLPPSNGLLFALHNNSEGYNMNEEIPISDRVHQPRPAEPHEFFLCSSPADFEIVAKGPYNALLQANPKGEEDGSLSRLAAHRGVRYVNLEVALGKLEVQKEMTAWLDRTLP